ncbi:MAG: DNA repair protein RecO [Planctomycetota bacterium]|jgi:DNA repair protein RecO (recombination protein O)
MASYWTSEALCLKVIDYRETSHIVTYLTPGRGKISAVAKGARRKGSKMFGEIEPLTRAQIVCAERRRSPLHTLTEVSVLDTYRGARKELSRLHASLYVLELARELTSDNDPAEPIYHLTVRALDRIARNKALHPLTLVIYELLVLEAAGLGLRLDACAECGRHRAEHFLFGPILGGALCPQCAPRDRDRRPLSQEALELLRTLQSQPDRAKGLHPDAPLLSELRGHLDAAIAARLERRPRLAKYLV